MLLALTGCTQSDTLVGWVADHGGVYECQATATDVLELCTELDRDELEQATGWPCWPTRRLWPALVGCIYGCYPHSGCNAHHGCFCPEAAP